MDQYELKACQGTGLNTTIKGRINRDDNLNKVLMANYMDEVVDHVPCHAESCTAPPSESMIIATTWKARPLACFDGLPSALQSGADFRGETWTNSICFLFSLWKDHHFPPRLIRLR